MVYVVEIMIEADLATELSQMRTWLDHMKFEPIGFRQIPSKRMCRVDFASEEEAKAFARAFAGEVLNRNAA